METELSAKEFILEHRNTFWTNDYYRIPMQFTRHGATVFFVQCDKVFPTWTVSVAREGRFACEHPETEKFVRKFLTEAGIRLKRNELSLVRSGNRTNAIFNHATTERGRRVTLARSKHGQIVPAFEEFVF